MTRAYLVYILMFAAAAGGLWVVLTLGAAMRAPDDLSGEWVVTWDNSPTTTPSNTVKIQQSGRFFAVQFGTSSPLSMTLDRGWRGRREGRMLQMRLRGDVWTLDVSGDIPLNNAKQVPAARLELSGPAKCIGIAQRGRPVGTANAR